MSRRPPRLCDAACGRPVRKRKGARWCSPCIAKKDKRTCVECERPFQVDMMANGQRCRGCFSAGTRAARVLKTYNITEQQYQELLASQGGVCYICRRKAGVRRHSVDHDHACCNGPVSCGRCVRGLLCNPCNKYLGHLRDSVDAAARVADYLAHPPAKRIWKDAA